MYPQVPRVPTMDPHHVHGVPPRWLLLTRERGVLNMPTREWSLWCCMDGQHCGNNYGISLPRGPTSSLLDTFMESSKVMSKSMVITWSMSLDKKNKREHTTFGANNSRGTSKLVTCEQIGTWTYVYWYKQLCCSRKSIQNGSEADTWCLPFVGIKIMYTMCLAVVSLPLHTPFDLRFCYADDYSCLMCVRSSLSTVRCPTRKTHTAWFHVVHESEENHQTCSTTHWSSFSSCRSWVKPGWTEYN
jgi:hypothetical protein